MKSCKNCEHFRESIVGLPFCNHPKMLLDDRVYGPRPRNLTDKAVTDECDAKGHFTAKQQPRGWFWWMCP